MSAASTTAAEPLDHDAAVQLDEQIQTLAGKTGEHLDYLADLLAEAKAGEIHQALGFPSWTAYLADRLKPITKALDSDERRALVMQLYESGFSVRDISAATNIPRSTVGDQVSGFGHVDAVTHGHDGKAYPRRRGNGGYRGHLKPHMRLNRAVKAIEGIDVAVAEDQAALRQQLQDTRNVLCGLIDQLLQSITTNESDSER